MASESGAVEGTSQNLRGVSSSSVRRKPEARSECLPAVPVPTVRMSSDEATRLITTIAIDEVRKAIASAATASNRNNQGMGADSAAGMAQV